MKKFLIFMALFLFVYIVSPGETIRAKPNIPQTIRVGLYFQDAYSNCVSHVTLKANGGIKIVDNKSGTIEALYDYNSNGNLVVRRDTSFILTNGIYMTLSGSTSLPGKIYGPYHIQIGGVFQDRASAAQYAASLLEKGIEAYPVYDNVWYVWSGFFKDKDSAQANILTFLAPNLGNTALSVIAPLNNTIVVHGQNSEIILVYIQSSGRLQFIPQSAPAIYVDSGQYRGSIEISRLAASDMTVVNVVDFEQYLYGVVPCEMTASSHAEALKAQAVAARTFAVNNLNKFSFLGFNVCSRTISQVYRGYSVENPATNKAVDDTRGKIATYNGMPISTVYFSSSGGVTEDAKNVWGYEVSYLKSVPDKYESGTSWNYNWSMEFTKEEIKTKLKEKGYTIGDVVTVSITDRAPTGRVTGMEIIGTEGKAAFTNANTRNILSLNSQQFTMKTDGEISIMNAEGISKASGVSLKLVVFSTGIAMFTDTPGDIAVVGAGGNTSSLAPAASKFVFTGTGWGHAVGMSQDGAKGMANAGFNYEQILKYYYSGINIE